MFLRSAINRTVFGCHLVPAGDSLPFPQCHSEAERPSTTVGRLRTPSALPEAQINIEKHRCDCHKSFKPVNSDRDVMIKHTDASTCL